MKQRNNFFFFFQEEKDCRYRSQQEDNGYLWKFRFLVRNILIHLRVSLSLSLSLSHTHTHTHTHTLSLPPFIHPFCWEIFLSLYLILLLRSRLDACVLAYVLSLCEPVDCSPQAPLSMGFFRQEVLERIAIFSSRGPSWPGTEPRSLASPALANRVFTAAPAAEPMHKCSSWYFS